ncbi:MAG: hypothetical protein PHH58_02375 [Rhodoferax sp.]|nr:hypothetical protein [Rhodoferax sp.]
MKDGPHIARIATLIGDRARAEVLTALLARVYALGWARRAKDSRVVQFTEPGEYAFRQLFKGEV